MITVAELIEMLYQVPQDLPVTIVVDHGQQPGIIDVSSIQAAELQDGEKVLLIYPHNEPEYKFSLN